VSLGHFGSNRWGQRTNVMTEGQNRQTQEADKAALSALGDKLRTKKPQPDQPKLVEGTSNLAVGLKYASEFTAAVLVGAAFGYFTDKLSGWSPFGLLTGLFLGLCAGVMNVVRAAKDGMDAPVENTEAD